MRRLRQFSSSAVSSHRDLVVIIFSRIDQELAVVLRRRLLLPYEQPFFGGGNDLLCPFWNMVYLSESLHMSTLKSVPFWPTAFLTAAGFYGRLIGRFRGVYALT